MKSITHTIIKSDEYYTVSIEEFEKRMMEAKEIAKELDNPIIFLRVTSSYGCTCCGSSEGELVLSGKKKRKVKKTIKKGKK